jgi:DNA-binding winged helix-turn-helix (wHTH) protein
MVVYNRSSLRLECTDRNYGINVSAREKVVIECLLNTRLQPVSVDGLLAVIYGDDAKVGGIAVVYNVISGLRAKLVELSGETKIIKTRAKVGYFIDLPLSAKKPAYRELADGLSMLSKLDYLSEHSEILSQSASIFKTL